jgi:hypothetical protein
MHFLIPTAGILLFFAGAADVWPHVVRASPSANHPDVTAAGGCKSVATFTSSAAPAFRSAGCIGCHGGAMATATTAFDLAKLGKDDVAACAQALKKVDVANKPASAIFQATTGSLAHAGGKVADAAGFTRAVHGWIDNE